MLLFKELAEVVKGKIGNFYHNYPVVHLLFDSRKIVSSLSSVFFAIKSDRRDGHDFIKELYEKGIRQFVVLKTYTVSLERYSDANFVLVDDTIEAIQDLTAYYRSQFRIPIIAITGSNGKTIVKEWISQLLADKYKLVKSPRSYNSQLGVPISVWQLNEQHELGLFEAGISKRGEMEKLERIIRPDIGILTNVGTAHDEGFRSREEKILEKLKLFVHSKILIYNTDQEEVKNILEREFPNLNTFTWGTNPKNHVFVKEVKEISGGSRITVQNKNHDLSFTVPFSDQASIQNILQALTLLFYLEVPADEISNGIKKLQPLGMRMELKGGINSCHIIDDAYSNDIASLAIALQFLDQQKQKNKHTVILSDLPESGMSPEQLYSEVATLLKSRNIGRLIGIGKSLALHKDKFELPSEFYKTTEDFLSSLNTESFSQEIILIKGARSFRFERIVALLSEKVHGTVLEVNLDALGHNLNYYRSFLNHGTKIMVMVKAFAYGSGSSEVAGLLQFHKVDYLGVAYTDEGVQLRNQGISLPIMVMNPSRESFEKILQYNLEPEIYSFKTLQELLDLLPQDTKRLRIHIKLDTGMHRLGYEEKDIEQLIGILTSDSRIKVQTIFTHLAGADDSCFNEFSLSQLTLFNSMADRIETAIGYKVIRHALNSAGIVRFPEHQMDMVRLGIGLYGVEATSTGQHKLMPIGTLKTTISQIKEIKQGDTVGYSRKGIVEKNKKVATIAIGYADGFNRRFSNGVGKVLINGSLCPIIGNVCMDMCMVDVTGVAANEGDEVIIFGAHPTIIEHAKAIGTIPYEILTSISQRVKRIFFSE